MIHTLFTILVGLAAMILLVLAAGALGWVASELDKVPTPEWLQVSGVFILLCAIVALAYNIGRYILGVL